MDLCTIHPKGRTLNIPYETEETKGGYLRLDIEENNFAGVFSPDEPPALPDVIGALAKAVENPVGGKRLSQLLSKAKKVAIITENQYRSAPTRQIVPWLLKKIRDVGATPVILIGCGKMAVLTDDAIEKKFGKEVTQSGVKIYCNDVRKPENYVYCGITSAGVGVWIHREVAEADTIITVSTTQATLWGYGGSGMIIPAVAGDETIEYNHVMSLAPDCVPGNNQCRMQKDKYEAAVIAGVDMGINCIVNNKSETTFINAGDFVKSHEETIRVYDKTYRFDASDFRTKKADIVITGSTAPVGHLFTHTCWSIVNCLPILKKGGTIIFASLCPAVGRLPGFALMDYLEPFLPASPENQELVLKSFYDHSNGLWTGCVWYKLYEAMLHADVHIVTDSSNHGLARKIGFSVFDTVDEAYQKALSKHGNLARVVYVPYGRYTILQV